MLYYIHLYSEQFNVDTLLSAEQSIPNLGHVMRTVENMDIL